MDTLRLIEEARIIPTLKLTSADDAPPLFAALCSGGMTSALVRIRSDAAYDILRQGARLFPDLLLGADGVSSTTEADTAIRSGARMIATYGFSREISQVCSDNDTIYIPFCLSPSELLAHQMNGGKVGGIFFPEAFDSLAAIEAFTDAFPRLPLIGGNIPLDKLSDYLAENAVIAVTCPELAEGSLDEIITKCQKVTVLGRDSRF